MKEIIAIIRPKQVGPTKEALAAAGIPELTGEPVLGRGKQYGLLVELASVTGVRPERCPATLPRMPYIPKRQLTVVVPDDLVDTVVRTILAMNCTGEIGDGRIFICPLDDAVRVRTAETGDQALS